jgi:hypothetical protein
MGSYEYANEPSGPIKGEKRTDQLSDYYQERPPWSSSTAQS